MKFELWKSGKIVGYEEHKESSYYNNPQIRIFHSKINSNIGQFDIKEWPQRFIEHDKKRCLHEDVVPAGGIVICQHCQYEEW